MALEVKYGPISREVDGKTQVALARYNGMDQDVSVGGRVYKFINRTGVSLCWVDSPDVEAVLMVTKVCCGGHTRRVFQYANSAQIDFWENLG